MMSSDRRLSRRNLLCAGIAVAVLTQGSLARLSAARADGQQPVDIVKGFYAVLLDCMKEGPQLGFDGRYQKIEPAVHDAFDVATMCKIAIGPSWTPMPAEKKNAVLLTFDHYMVTSYASRFKAFKGQQFVVGDAKQAGADRVLVESKLIKSDGEPVALNYLFRQTQGVWKIIDIYLSGTISEMARMRSDFSDTLQSGGADALIASLDAKIKELQAGA
jgi:phospholipid transport system substrate-binding protein